jgi:hypothetical protein
VKHPLHLLVVVALTACTSDVTPTAPPSAPPTTPSFATTTAQQLYFFKAHAVVIKGSVLGIPLNIVEAGPLPTTGGQGASGLGTYSLPGVVTASLLNASVNATPGPDAANTHALANASVANLSVLAGLNTIKAAALNAAADARCKSVNDDAASVLVKALIVNGKPIVIGGPNQVVPLILGQLIINEQIRTPGGITANALHLKVGLIDVIIAHAFADIGLC